MSDPQIEPKVEDDPKPELTKPEEIENFDNGLRDEPDSDDTEISFSEKKMKTYSVINKERQEFIADMLADYKALKFQMGDVDASLVHNLLVENELLRLDVEKLTGELEHAEQLRKEMEEELRLYKMDPQKAGKTNHNDLRRLWMSIENFKEVIAGKRREEEDRHDRLEEELCRLLSEDLNLSQDKEGMSFAKTCSKGKPEWDTSCKITGLRPEGKLESRSTAHVLKQKPITRKRNGVLPPIVVADSEYIRMKPKISKRKASRQTRSTMALSHDNSSNPHWR